MQTTGKFSKHQGLIIFFFCLAVIFGPAISILFENNLSQFTDCNTYIALFHFDFDQSPVRRYRIIVPMVARALHLVFGGIFGKLAPTYYIGDISMAFSFFVLNSALTALTGVLLYRYCRAYKLGVLGSIIGLLVFLTCRYTIYFAAIPLVDAFYFLVTMMVVLGIKTKNTALLTAAVFIGPFAKESFIFIAPVIFFFSHISKKKLLLYFLASGILVFSFRYSMDAYFGFPTSQSLQADVHHIWGLKHIITRVFSPYGLYKMLINIGIWLLLPLFGIWQVPALAKNIIRRFEPYVWWYLVAVFIQMALSTSVERMFYLAMPVISVVMGLSAEAIFRKFNKTGFTDELIKSDA